LEKKTTHRLTTCENVKRRRKAKLGPGSANDNPKKKKKNEAKPDCEADEKAGPKKEEHPHRGRSQKLLTIEKRKAFGGSQRNGQKGD